MNKIVNFKVVIILLISLIPTICNAKMIKIDDIEYNVNIGDTISSENFTYTAVSDTLILKDATLKTIYTKEDLNIILIGDNYFTSGTRESIVAKNLTISGLGTLNIKSSYTGIAGDKITINNTTLNINASNFCLSVFSTDHKDLIVNNSKLTLASNYNIFNAFKANLYLNNSQITVTNGYSFLDTNSYNIYLNNTTLNAKVSTIINSVGNYVYVNGQSKVKIENKSNCLLSKNYILTDNLKIQGSEDNITYQPITDISKDKFIYIYSLDEDLYEKEKKLLNKEQEIKNQEEQLNNSKHQLTLKEQEIKNQEEQLNNLKHQLTLKEQEIKKQETNNITNKEEKNDLETIKTNLQLSTNNIENPKTYDNIINYLLILGSSLIIFVISLIIRRKWSYGKI